jgi:hypothetical protein
VDFVAAYVRYLIEGFMRLNIIFGVQPASRRAMPDYKFYPVDKKGHILAPPRIVRAMTDDEALERGKQLLDGHDLEAWEGTRRLGTLPAPQQK